MKWFLIVAITLALTALPMFFQKRRVQPPAWATTQHHSKEPLMDRYSIDVLPANAEMLKRPITPNNPARILAQDTPTLDREASGPYSYLGAAREFKYCTGADMPDWVKPVEGRYTVSKRAPGFLCNTKLVYEVDSARYSELQRLITEGIARRWPEMEGTLGWYPNSSKTGYRAGFAIPASYDTWKIDLSLGLRDGKLHISSHRGYKDD